MTTGKFCHLHLHSQYSLLDGFGSAEMYVDRAKEIGMEYLACTDHASIDGLIKFQKACDKQGIKPVLGSELYIVPDASIKEKGDVRGHIVVLVKNDQGWKNLCRLLTIANLDGFYYKPRIGYQDLFNYCRGLVIMTGCAMTFLNQPGGRDFFRDLLRVVRDDLYLEVMPHSINDQIRVNQLCVSLADKYDVPLVATNDCHYILETQAQTQEVLLAIQTKAKWSDPARYRFGIEGLFLRSEQQMVKAFEKQGILTKSEINEGIRSTIDIAKKCCDFRIKKQDIYLPIVPGFERKDVESYLLNEARASLEYKSANWPQKKYDMYYDRLMDEWQLIKSKKFVGYFLIVKEIVDWCNDQGIMMGPGRGSVGGSLLAYLLDITTIDPIKYNLLFSRFISEERIDYPDIDMDFPDNKRALIREHLEELYGKNNISSISTFLTMKGRAAIRDVARVFDIPLEDVDPFAKILDASDKDEGVIESALDTPEGRRFYKKYSDETNLAMELEGQIRGAGQHAAACVVSADDLTQGSRGNLAIRSQMIVSNWDMEDSEYVGLMKLDILGLNTLTVLNEVKRLISESDQKVFLYHPESCCYLAGNRDDLTDELIEIDLDFALLKPTDPDVFKDLAEGNTVGVFQVNTYGGTKMCQQVKVEDFDMLSDILALVRPGPSDSGMTQEYIDRHNGKKWKGKHPKYEEIVKDTYGIIIYQEQVMQVIHKIAGLSYPTADKIRKIISKKRDVKEFAQYKQSFIDGCLKQGMFDGIEAEDFWQMLEAHASYSFNKSHSVAYAMLAYWCSWVKHYYPTEFICAALTYSPESKKEELVREARRLGCKVMLPQVGVSQADKWIVKENVLYAPFLEIKGIGDKGAQQCVDSKQSKSVSGFFAAKNTVVRSTKITKILNDIGAFGNTPQAKDLQSYFTFDIDLVRSDNYIKLQRLTRGHSNNLDDLISMNFFMKGLIRTASFSDRSLADCTKCPLRQECKGPVLPSEGKFNMAIVGEGPGKEEDEQGKGFVGRSGDLLWGELDKYDLPRELFHVTNIVKCYPRLTRTPTMEQINICKPWLLNELKMIDARFILAFGNTGLKALAGRDKGIMDKSGTIEWIEDIGAWVCWCVHPSAVLHNPNNKQIFFDGIKVFADKIYQIGKGVI